MADATILKFPTHREPTGVAVPETAHSLRLRRIFTQKELAGKLNKPTSWVSKVENGTIALEGRDLDAWASALQVKPSLLMEKLPDVEESAAYFRKYDIPQKIVKFIKSEASIRTHTVTKLAKAAGISLKPKYIEFDCSTTEDGVLGVARYYRQRWGVGNDPIKHIAGLIENEGVHITPMPKQVTKVAGFSTHKHDGTCNITMFNTLLHGNTQRFTIAHEFGHLVLDRLSPELDYKEKERRADAFAGELLAPYLYLQNDIRALRKNDVASLLRLSAHWGLHPKSFITRGKLEGDISEFQATDWYKSLGRSTKILIDATPTPYPVELNLIGTYVEDLSENQWLEIDLEKETSLTTAELLEMATENRWPYTLPSAHTTYKPLQLV